jgi:hypothetical protein
VGGSSPSDPPKYWVSSLKNLTRNSLIQLRTLFSSLVVFPYPVNNFISLLIVGSRSVDSDSVLGMTEGYIHWTLHSAACYLFAMRFLFENYIWTYQIA